MRIEIRSPGHMMRALASDKNVRLLPSAIDLCCIPGWHSPQTILPVRKLVVQALLYIRKQLLFCSCVGICW